MKRMSRRGFFAAFGGEPTRGAPLAPVSGPRLVPTPAPAPARTFLEDFYASRAANPALVYEPSTFVWDEALIAKCKRKERP